MSKKTSSEALAAFDRKAAANLERALAMALVERDGDGRWCVRLWHGVTNTKTGERAGVQTLRTFGATQEGHDEAQQMRRLLAWWMKVALNLYGKPPAVATAEVK